MKFDFRYFSAKGQAYLAGRLAGSSSDQVPIAKDKAGHIGPVQTAYAVLQPEQKPSSVDVRYSPNQKIKDAYQKGDTLNPLPTIETSKAKTFYLKNETSC